MKYRLENNLVSIEAKAFGAELSSYFVKGIDKEFVWQADPEFWKRHAPVLFPIVGKVWDNTYRINGKTFNLTQHGFARDMQFNLVHQSNSQLIFELSSSKESLVKYPFSFKLITTYTLKDKQLKVKYTVENTDEKTILFCIGAHPAFYCPFDSGNLDDYELSLEKNESSNRLLLTPEGFRSGKVSNNYLNGNTIPLSEELFKDDALIFDDLQSTNLLIKKKKGSSSLKVGWFGFPHMGIWKSPKSPFICIEPWQGMADLENFMEDFSKKKGVIALEQTKTFEAGYTVEFVSE